MFPVFGRLFGEPIPAYFTLLMTGFAVATLIASRWAKRAGLDHDVMIDLALISVLSGVAGGRLLHVIADGQFWDYVHLCTDPQRVIWHTVEGQRQCLDLGGAWDAGVCRAKERDCFAWAAFWNGGLAYYGGLLSATVTGLWFLRREGFPVWKGADAAAAVIPLGIFFGRLGCFFGGCCFGLITEHPWGLSFPGGSPASLKHAELQLLAHSGQDSLPVHPTQLYESLGCLAISAYLLLWLAPRKRFDGQVLLACLGLYAALRFGLEFLRADDRGSLLGLSTSQLIGVLILLAVVAAYRPLRNRRDQALQQPAAAGPPPALEPG